MDSPSLEQNLTDQAVKLALASKWIEAIKVNQTILKKNPEDIDTLNRIAHACTQAGNLLKAKKYYRQVLRLDAYNIIAQKNLDKLQRGPLRGGNGTKNGEMITFNVHNFLSEPGKTKIATCVKLAMPKILASKVAAEGVKLIFKKHSVAIIDGENQYLGALPDDLSFHLINLNKTGNKYDAFIKSVSPKSLQIFIREIFKSKRMANQPSFPAVTSGTRSGGEDSQDED